jgi:hypothetical protein
MSGLLYWGGVDISLEGAFFLETVNEAVSVENGERVVGDGDGGELAFFWRRVCGR